MLDIPTPVVLPPSGTYIGIINVVMLLPESLRNLGQIHYTLDGSLPSSTSPIYRGGETLRALNAERRFTVKAVIWVDALPFWGDIETREYQVMAWRRGSSSLRAPRKQP